MGAVAVKRGGREGRERARERGRERERWGIERECRKHTVR